MVTKQTLSRDDWVIAGFRALNAGGPQAIKVEAVARQLGISKGSFYWHYKNVKELKDAMLEHWIHIATNAIITAVQETSKDPATQLRYLVGISSGNIPTLFLKDTTNEAAIRDWARYDSGVAGAIKLVDQKRLQFLQDLFVQTGASKTSSNSKATFLYSALIGLEHLSRHSLVDLKKALPEFLDALLTRID